MVMVASGCAVDSDRTMVMQGGGVDVTVSTARAGEGQAVDSTDVCTLAAALPSDNICSLICDPAALNDRLSGLGDAPGRCIELDCRLSDATSVKVGVCIVPPDSLHQRPAAHPAGSLSHT
jgi:hypothetical protein